MDKLLKCKEYDEIFIVEDGKKSWIQDWKTFVFVAEQNGMTWSEFMSQMEVVPFEELRDTYPVGSTKVVETVTQIVEGEEPKDIWYPTTEENPYCWIRGLLTLKPIPSTQKALDLSFNLMAPYAGLSSGWISKGGKIIFTTKTIRSDETGIIAYSTCDEPDCHKHSPQGELELVKRMQNETDLPVGTTLVGDIGCGISGTAPSKESYKKQWVEAVNQMDFVAIDVYPYRKPEYMDGRTPVETMEFRHEFQTENITVPIIMIIQAHWNYPDQLQPDAMEQVKFWLSRGYGYIVYTWHNGYTGVRDRQEEWKQANEWAKEEVS